MVTGMRAPPAATALSSVASGKTSANSSAAQAPGNVGGALLLLQNIGDRLDDFVAGVVAVSVVDRLEVIDVAHQESQRPAVAAKARPFGLRQVEKIAPVVEPGHAVDRREPLQRLALAHQIADIAVSEEPAAVGQCLAVKADDFAGLEPDIERAVMAGADRFELAGEIVAKRVRRHRVSCVAAAVIHQLDETRPAVGDVVGQAPEAAEGAVDELHVARRIEHDDAVIEIVDDRAQCGKLRRGFGGRNTVGIVRAARSQPVGTPAHAHGHSLERIPIVFMHSLHA